jgi:hypothetical protein
MCLIQRPGVRGLIRRAIPPPDGQITQKSVHPFVQKYSASLQTQINFISIDVPARERGVSRSSQTLGRDAVDAGCALDERCGWRTAKSCGPDAPTLASSS